MSNVRCKECGLLGVRHHSTGKVLEYTQRMYGVGSYREQNRDYIPEIFCYADAHDLEKEAPRSSYPGPVQKAVDRPRECNQFIKKMPGRTPKEHSQMLWERQLAEDERHWREGQAAREREWRKEDIALIKESMRVTIRSYILGGVITGLFGIIAAILAYLLGAASN